MATGSINLANVNISLAAQTMKRHILTLGKTNKFDLDLFRTEAETMKPLAEKVGQLIDSKASVDDICNAIGDVLEACKTKVYDLLEGEVAKRRFCQGCGIRGGIRQRLW